MAAGNENGQVHVSATESDFRVTLSVPRGAGRVTSCGLSEDCRHVLVAMAGGFVYRLDAPLPTGAGPEQSDNEEALPVK